MDRKSLARTIWKEVFGDDERFLDLYFTRVYRCDETLLFVDYNRETAVSHLGMPVYLINWNGYLVRAYYISGAATLPEARGKGRMQSLMRTAHMKMYSRGALFSFLIPAEESLYDYYEETADYVPVAKARTLFRRREEFENDQQLPRENQNGALHGAYLRDVQLRGLCFQSHIHHTFESWYTALLCAQLYGGGAVVVEGQPLLLFESSTSSKWTMLAVFPNSGTPRSNDIGSAYRHGMLRLINVAGVLRLHARQHPHVSLQFDLYDRDLMPNSGRYRLEGGKLLFTPFRGAPLKRLAAAADDLRKTGLKKGTTPSTHQQLYTPVSLASRLFPNAPFHFDLLLDPINEKRVV